MRLPDKWPDHLEFYATNLLYNINVHNLYNHIDNIYNSLFYKFAKNIM